MKTLPILLFWWVALAGSAQNSLPTIRILPEDVVQSSVCQVSSPLGTNKYAIKWTYTELGAKKMLAFWREHAGEKVLQQVGEFECRPLISAAKSPGWTEQGWLKSRTDKFLEVSDVDAERIVAGLKGKR